MANFLYWHPSDNVAPNATPTWSTGTANASYPVANATDLRYAKLASPAKIAEVTGALLLDFGSAQRVDYVVLWHNFDAALACAVQMNATNAWGAPTVTTSPTVPAKRKNNYTKKIGVDLRSVSGYSTGGFRYLRINVSGANSVALGLKVLAFSTVRSTVRNIGWGLKWVRQQMAVDMTTDAGVPWTYNLGGARRQLSGDILAKNADAVALDDWFDACDGRAKITAVVLDPSDPDPILGQLGDGGLSLVAPGLKAFQTEDTHDFTHAHQRRLVIDEVTAGDPEWT